MIVHNQHQSKMRSGTGRTSIGGNCCAPSLAADEAQGGRCVPSVGATSRVPSRLFDAPRKSRNANLPLRAQLGGGFGLGSFSLRIMGRSRQFRLPEHVTRQCPDALEGHVQNVLSTSLFQRPNRDTSERPKSWKHQPVRSAS